MRGREKVNWPEGPREAGLGRDPGAPKPGACRGVRRHEMHPREGGKLPTCRSMGTSAPTGGNKPEFS